MKRQKIVTFGELLLRFSKPGQLRLTQGDMFTSKYGGSEANVAVSLAAQGEDVTYITRLPDSPVGHAGAQCLAQLGVDISHVVYGDSASAPTISNLLLVCELPRWCTTVPILPIMNWLQA